MFVQKSLLAILIPIYIGGSVALAEPFSTNSNAANNPERLLSQDQPQNQPIRRFNRGGKWGQGKLIEQLNLTEDQKQKLSTIRQKYQDRLQSLREQIKTKHQELSNMMAGNASVAQIRSQHQEILNLREQMGNIRLESMLEMREVLTPEQRTEFSQLMQKHHQQFRQRRGGNFDDEQ